MKPLVNSGDLVDFKINLIFEKEKDTAQGSSEKFYKKVKRTYKYEGDLVSLSSLYKKIINYQVKKYGSTITDVDCNYGYFSKKEYHNIRDAKRRKYIHKRNRSI